MKNLKNLKKMIFLTLMYSFSFSFGFKASARVVDKIDAIVNDQIITMTDLEKFRKRLVTGGLNDDALLRLTDIEVLKKDRNALLNHIIDERLIDSDVKRKGMEVTIERVEQEIRSIAQGNNISRNQLRDALVAKGVTMSEYQDFIKTSLERQQLIEREVTSKIRISDEDIKSYYLAHYGTSGEQAYEYQLSHILFSNKDKGDENALARAKQVLEKLREGASFDKMAEQYSQDPSFSKGGDFGTMTLTDMSKDFADAVRKVQPGEVTEPAKSPQGYHLLKVVKRTLINDPNLDAHQEEIRNTIYAVEFKRVFRLWLNQRKDEAYIRINGV